MKKAAYLALCVLLSVTLAACEGAPAETAPEPTPGITAETLPPSPSQTPAPAPTPSPEPTPEPPQMSMLSEENAPARAAYAKVLKTLLDTNVLPGETDPPGGYIGSIAEREGMAQNQFAVWDVDGDGREELILLYTTTIVAGERGYVIDYGAAADETRIQYEGFPIFTFYENGALKEGWSHNQGKGGAFWPYFLYTYDAENDAYQEAGAVDAWDRNLGLEGYPEEADRSGTGFVYYIYNDLAAEWDKIDPVDDVQYREWLAPYLGEGREITIPYAALTAENIQFMVTPG